MILADTTILGTFARVEALDFLFELFGENEIGVAPAVRCVIVSYEGD